MQSLKVALEKYTVSVVVVVLALFVTFGVVYAASEQTNCGIGAREDGEAGSETNKRSDDQSFFSHLVCKSEKAQHNR
jgi:archaellum component FlaF (FlaF/FlaG flagellin family)